MNFEGVVASVAVCITVLAAFIAGVMMCGSTITDECKTFGKTRLNGQVFICIRQETVIR